MTPKAGILAASVSLVALTGAFVYEQGAVRVEVREKARGGEHIRLAVPALVAPIAARLVPREKLRRASRDLQQWLPAIEVASEELLRCPDGPLVEVDSRTEHVRIAKQGDSLVVDVDDPGETVHVSFPLRMLAYTASQLVANEPAS
jgi:hypothetical protein